MNFTPFSKYGLICKERREVESCENAGMFKIIKAKTKSIFFILKY